MALVFPAASDVKIGVQFGPITGTEFTGTRTDAATSDVRNGVTYGGDGTEFTGSLTITGVKLRIGG